MTKKISDIVKYWHELSDYDIRTAEYMFKTKRYPYCLFMCHLSIEKILKAIIVKKINSHAPYSHNLVDLAKRTKLDFNTTQKDLLADLTEFNLEARYPEWQKEFYKKATKNYTEQYFKNSIKLQKWLKNQIKK
jgi:HEPN domain-containing protein